jgi:predicted nucleic acid-binding protein
MGVTVDSSVLMAAERTGSGLNLPAVLVRSGTMIGAVDLLIAASALERDGSLATFDVRHFGRVPGLRILAA